MYGANFMPAIECVVRIYSFNLNVGLRVFKKRILFTTKFYLFYWKSKST